MKVLHHLQLIKLTNWFIRSYLNFLYFLVVQILILKTILRVNMNSILKYTSYIFILVLIYNCSTPTLQSKLKDHVISVDGNRQEWEGELKYFKDEKVAIGISNDSNNVYFCLATSDNSKIMKILRSGFTIWLDPQNSDGKTLGIQYPIRKERKSDINGISGNRKKNILGGFNAKKMIEKLEANQYEFLILNEDKFPLNAYPLKNDSGVEVRIGYEMNQLVYELKMPLANNKYSQIYTDALPNEILKVGFETGEFDRPERGERGNQGMRGQGGGMTGGGRGGMRGGQRPNMNNMQKMMEPLQFWIEVKLAGK